MKNRLKELREENKLTQLELAAKLNLSKPTISKYEDGSVDMSSETLAICSKLFNCSIDYILFQTAIRSNVPTEMADRLMDELQDYNRAFKLARESTVTPQQIEEQLLLWNKMRGK